MRYALRPLRWLLAALFVILLGPALPEVHANEWVDYDDAVRQATRENKFILVNVEERVLSSMWRRGTAFTNGDVQDLLASDFVTVFLDLTEDADVTKASELGLPDGSLAVLDVDGTVLGNWPDIVDGSELADALRGVIDSAGKRPSARDLKNLREDLEDAREELDEGKVDRAIKSLLDVVEEGFRGEPVREARALLRALALDAQLLIARAQLAQAAGEWGLAYIYLDRAEEEFDGLDESETAKDALRDLRREDGYKDWKDTAKTSSEAAWAALDTAEESGDTEAILTAVAALHAIGNPADVKDLSKRLNDFDEIEHDGATVETLAQQAIGAAEVARLLADAHALADRGVNALASRAFMQAATHPNATPEQVDDAKSALANIGD